MATALSSCDGWIDNAKTPNNMLTTEQITTPSMLATIRTENIKDGAINAPSARTFTATLAVEF